MADELDELMAGRSVSAAKRVAYFLYALAAVLPAALLFVQIFVVDVARSVLTIVAGVVATAALLSAAYHNLCAAHAERIRESAVPPVKAAFKGKKAEFEAAVAAHDKKVEASALAYSVFYNNALFLVSAPFVGCYIFSDKFSGDLNFLVSSTAAAGLALFNSQSALKAMSS
jgi:Translocon-associated protein, gamma subunit (TRAP-gamma)